MSVAIFFVSTITAGKSTHIRVYTFNMSAAGWSAIAFDAICMPRFMVLFTVGGLIGYRHRREFLFMHRCIVPCGEAYTDTCERLIQSLA
jgi:hypothetical protein